MIAGSLLLVIGAFLLYLLFTGKVGKFVSSWQATA